MSTKKKKSSPGVRSVSRPLVMLGILLFISIFAMLGSLLYVANKRADQQQHAELASEQLLLSQSMATQALGASSGRESDFAALLDGRDRFENILGTYRTGDSLNGVPPLREDLITLQEDVDASWRNFSNDISIIIKGKEPISEVRELYTVIDSFIPQLLTFSDEVVGVLMKKNASSRQIYLASRQMMLSQRIKNNLNQVLAGGEQAAAAADRFGRDAALFGRVLEGLLKGSDTLRIEKVTDKEAVAKLREVTMLISAVSDNIAGILELSPELFEVKDAASQVTTGSAELLDVLKALRDGITGQTKMLDMIQLGGVGFGALAVVLIIISGFLMLRDAKAREEQALENNRRNQRAILRLLDEMANLADGDLTVHTTVTEEITGAIADSVNFAIDALRTLVTTINNTSTEVTASTSNAQGTAMSLAEASNTRRVRLHLPVRRLPTWLNRCRT